MQLALEVDGALLDADKALRHLERYRDRYEFDRAYRLLEAVAGGGQVQPISPVDALLFRREAEFGEMPLDEAFKSLTSVIPALGNLEESVRDARLPQMGQADWQSGGRQRLSTMRRVRKLVGPGAKHDDPLLNSYLSRNVALIYLESLENGATAGGLSSYFKLERR